MILDLLSRSSLNEEVKTRLLATIHSIVALRTTTTLGIAFTLEDIALGYTDNKAQDTVCTRR
jgi:hypothetical protein